MTPIKRELAEGPSNEIPQIHAKTIGELIIEARSNPDLTIRERIRRKVELHNEAIRHSWPVWRHASRLNDLRNRILTNNLHLSDPKTFYQINTTQNSQNKYIIPIRVT